MTYWIVKIVSLCLCPVTVALAALAVGLFLLFRTKRQRAGRWCVAGGVAILFLFGLPWAPRWLTRAVERGIAPCLDPAHVLHEARPDRSEADGPVYVVVLGTGFNPVAHYPRNLQVDPGFWSRLSEGVRVHRLLPGSRLVVSLPGEATLAEKEAFLRDVCGTLGVDLASTQLVADARTTADEARLVAEVAGQTPVFVVSSGLYLRRQTATFLAAGLDAFPAPSALSAPDFAYPSFTILALFPSPENLLMSKRAIRELVGLAAARMKGALRG